MQNSNIVKVSFRFKRLDKLQAFTLVRETSSAFYNESTKDNYYVGYVDLIDNNIDDINDFYVRQRIALDEVDIFISVNAEPGTDSISIPTVVNRMLKYIDCKLAFSFTVM